MSKVRCICEEKRSQLRDYHELDPAYRTFFYHIPKCGGRWVKRLLDHHGVVTLHDKDPHPTAFHRLIGHRPSAQSEINWHDPKNPSKLVPTKLWYPQPRGVMSPPDRYKKSFRFATVRNPFDWLVSYFLHDGNGQDGFGGINRTHGIRSFPEFIARITDPEFNWDLMHRAWRKMLGQVFDEKGVSHVHALIRVEEMTEIIPELLECLGYPPVENFLFKQASSHRRNGRQYSEFYDNKLIAKVEDYYGDIINGLGYSYAGNIDRSGILWCEDVHQVY